MSAPVQDVTARIFAAALDPSGWQNVLDTLAQHLDGAKLHLFGHDIASRLNLGTMFSGHDPAMADEWVLHYAAVNPYPAALGAHRSGEVLPLKALVREPEVLQTEYYAGFLRPQEDLRSGTGVLLDVSPGSVFVLGTLHPSRHRGTLDRKALALLQALAPSLQAGWHLSRIVCGGALQDGRVLEGLRQPGVAICDLSGWPRYVSPAAERWISIGDVVHLDPRGRVVFADPGTEARASALRYALAGRTPAGPVLGLKQAGGRTVDLMPVPSGEGFGNVLNGSAALPLGLNGPALIVVLHDSPRRGGDAAKRAGLASMGLTAAEVEVAFTLAKGLSPTEIAELRNVSPHTVRNQIKTIFGKCGVSRQAQLAALVARL